jgi:exopolysaccharide biosynthesis polyprenyl glycosylphosphotransferase
MRGGAMFGERRHILLGLLKLSDLVIMTLSVFVSIWYITYEVETSFMDFMSLRVKLVNVMGFVGMLIIWQFLFHNLRLYQSRRMESGFQESKDILKATTLGTAAFMLLGRLFDTSIFASYSAIVFWFTSSALTLGFRAILRFALREIRLKGRNLRNVIIVGSNPKAYEYGDKLESNKELGYRVVGYIDDEIYSPHKGRASLGTVENIATLLASNVVDEVVIALPIKSQYEMIQEIVERAEEQGVIVRYLYPLFNTSIASVRAETFSDSAVLTISSWPYEDWQFAVKRTLDFVLSLIMTIVFAPLLLGAAIAIKMTSPGPVFFAQDRVGFNKRIFKLYKFRTMVTDAEKLQDDLEKKNEMDGPVFKIKDDPRITRVGRWLRNTSVDELPQLFNILKGDMSLVGPRPLPVRDYHGFDKDWHRRRLSVPPGITCIWQITGRNSISFEEWMKLDMQYIDNWKLSLDFKILLMTVPAVLTKRGAA